jgi:sporulation protein YlmC with PRC-barrel domain
MRMRNVTVIAISLATATGCMHGQKQADRQHPSGAAEVDSNVAPPTAPEQVAQATTPPEAQHPLNHVERADKLIGEGVLTSDHLRAGKIEDFVVDQGSGQILYAIVGIGGVLGVGETRVAVPPGLFIEARNGMVQIKDDKHKLTGAPQIPKAADQVDAKYLSNVYGYFGQPATWAGTSSSAQAPTQNARKVSEIMGMKIVNSAHQDIGKVETVVLDVPGGLELYVVLFPCTEMNLGNTYYAIPPKALTLSPDQKGLVSDLSREKLASAPHFAKDDLSELSNSAWARKDYQYFGQAFPTGGLVPTGRTGDTTTNVYPKQK